MVTEAPAAPHGNRLWSPLGRTALNSFAHQAADVPRGQPEFFGECRPVEAIEPPTDLRLHTQALTRASSWNIDITAPQPQNDAVYQRSGCFITCGNAEALRNGSCFLLEDLQRIIGRRGFGRSQSEIGAKSSSSEKAAGRAGWRIAGRV